MNPYFSYFTKRSGAYANAQSIQRGNARKTYRACPKLTGIAEAENSLSKCVSKEITISIAMTTRNEPEELYVLVIREINYAVS